MQVYLVPLKTQGAVVNTAIAIGCAEGIVKSKDSNLLPSNGGHISLLSTGASISLLALALSSVERALRQDYSTVPNFEEAKALLFDI